ncbi:hypothetical protein JOB18_017891 [Solea senegalensis]|uniref:Uncharacterized protein n=1 Tax=Solea senegalensis TaxID=28829 RepID=A0AAV6T6C6_SOLSE|nr:hypothetical protein JOB18_017891 [Solea senegalensis]
MSNDRCGAVEMILRHILGGSAVGHLSVSLLAVTFCARGEKQNPAPNVSTAASYVGKLLPALHYVCG